MAPKHGEIVWNDDAEETILEMARQHGARVIASQAESLDNAVRLNAQGQSKDEIRSALDAELLELGWTLPEENCSAYVDAIIAGEPRPFAIETR